MSEQKLTEEQVREEYRQQRKDKTFAQCWPANNDSFYESIFWVIEKYCWNIYVWYSNIFFIKSDWFSY